MCDRPMNCDCKTPTPYQNFPSLCARCMHYIESYNCAFCRKVLKDGILLVVDGKADNDLATCSTCYKNYIVPLQQE